MYFVVSVMLRLYAGTMLILRPSTSLLLDGGMGALEVMFVIEIWNPSAAFDSELIKSVVPELVRLIR